LDDTSKSKNEETPKPPVEDVKEETAEEPQPEETSEKQTEGKSDNEEEKPSEPTEKTDKEKKPTEEPSKVEEQPTEEAPKTEEEKPADEQKTEEPPKEEAGEPEKAEEKPEQPVEPPKEEATEETKGEEKPVGEPEKAEEKPEQPIESKAKKDEEKAETKKKHEKDDFNYIVRLANTDIDGKKAVAQGLTTIKGVGAHMSVLIIDETGIDRSTKMGNLTDAQIEKIQIALGNITKNAPVWMLNRRKDYDTGKDIHLIGPEIDMRLRDEINIMKKIRSYRGIRHERGLSVRGQRTRANNRRGLALGVSKKRVLDKK